MAVKIKIKSKFYSQDTQVEVYSLIRFFNLEILVLKKWKPALNKLTIQQKVHL